MMANVKKIINSNWEKKNFFRVKREKKKIFSQSVNS
jgi:hypothetical protein